MKILICPDSFKECLSAYEVATYIEKGLKKANPKFEIEKIPIADGGEGTVECVIRRLKAKLIKCKVTGPLGNKVTACYGLINHTAIIEMAQASGLSLVPREKRNPMKTTTYGTGELIKDALNRGCKKIIIGIGGSATVDGGIGMAQALGIKFLDKRNKNVGFGGENLLKIKKIDMSCMDKRIHNTEIIVASDVKNPLLGRKGAARVYGPQKGATPKMVEVLEKGLKNLSDQIKRDLKIDVKNIKGAGAAGGLGAGLVAFLNAKIFSGVKLIAKLINLESHIKNSDLIITGEGKIDKQTLYGKAITEVINIAQKYKKPVICIAGSVTPEAKALHKSGVIGLFSIITTPMSLEFAMKNAPELLERTAENVGYVIKNLKP